MKTMLVFVGWCILLVLCWPVALLALILFPFVWLISIPFRLVGITFEAVFAFLKAVLFLPARLLGYKPGSPSRAVART
jgi:hypothetical protein